MIAEILATGDEIRSGALIDSNTAHIAQELEVVGVKVVRHSSVGDDVEIIVSVLNEIGRRADICVVTGGLGPTTDDLTTEAASKAAGVELFLDQTALAAIKNIFKKLNRPMNDSNIKQAIFPVGATRMDNPVGTAPGFMLKIDKCYFFFLPGVPAEMRTMLSDKVIPIIKKFPGNRKVCLTNTISTFGLTESATGERIAGLAEEFPGIKLGLRAKFPEIHIKLYAYGDDPIRLNELLSKTSDWILDKMGKSVLSVTGDSMASVIGDLLKRQKSSIAVAESCTGGLVAHWLTNSPGASDYFIFSGVTYSNRAKIDLLGVLSETIERFGAVHEETAKEMAKGVRRIAGATYGLSISGIAGPDGGTEAKPVGTVCIGLAAPDGVQGRRFNFSFGKRSMNKVIFAETALDLLRIKLLKAGQTETIS